MRLIYIKKYNNTKNNVAH